MSSCDSWSSCGTGEASSWCPSPRSRSSNEGAASSGAHLRFKRTAIGDVVIVEQDRHADERGWFSRVWCAREFSEAGLEHRLAQCSVSFNRRCGTLRGMHYQVPPRGESKLVRCSRGALFDVAVDLRPDSATFLHWVGVELTEANGWALYIPRGFAHGFLTLQDSTEVTYQISEEYSPQHARGMRWNDPRIGIHWPGPIEVMAARDRAYPDLDLLDLESLRKCP